MLLRQKLALRARNLAACGIVLFSVRAACDDPPVPDAHALLLEVWQAEEQITTVRGAYMSEESIAPDLSTGPYHKELNSEIALEYGKQFYGRASAGDGYTIAATQRRVTRSDPRVLEEFPLSVWNDKPWTLAYEVFNERWNLEQLLRPLHTFVGYGRSVTELLQFKNAAVTVENDHFFVDYRNTKQDLTLTLRVARTPIPHLLESSNSSHGVRIRNVYQGRELGKPAVWVVVGSQESITFPDSSTMTTTKSLAVLADSVNSPLPESLFEVNKGAGTSYVDYRHIGNRFSYWRANATWDWEDLTANPAKVFDDSRDMFPVLASILIVATVVTAVALTALVSYTIVRFARRRVTRQKNLNSAGPA